MSLGESAQLASLVRHYRLAAGLSQEDLAERTGLSVRTISDFERGLRVAPRLESIRMLADGLGLADSERALLIAAARPELTMHPPGRSNDELSFLGKPFVEIPNAPGALIGREREVADLISMLSIGTSRLITLTGPGGVGKTRLALAVARDVAPAFSGGVVFVALAPVRDPSLVLSTIARALGVQETGDQPLVERVCGFLANRAALLVLDNMEQVMEAATDVAALLAAAPELRVLVTSRGPLRLSGEHLFPVPALSLPAPAGLQTLQEVAASEAVALFIDRAQMVQPGFSLTQANAPAIMEICHRLDGLPLAIELAAARIPLLPPATLLARMERRLPLLTGGARDLPARLQTMRAAIAWSYDLLSPEEQTVFRRLSVFAGGFTLEAAEWVMAEGGEGVVDRAPSTAHLDRIAALVERGLVWQTEQSDGDARFGLLETIREFGLECLEASGEEESVRRTHAAWYLALAEDFDPVGHAVTASSLDRLERELPNFRVALAWTEQAEDTVLGLRLAQSLSLLWHVRSHRAEGRGWLERALARDPGTHATPRAAALVQLGHIEHNLGNTELGARHLNKALELALELDDRRSIAFALVLLAAFAVDAGDDEPAGQFLAEVEGWMEGHGDWKDVLGLVLVNRGILARRFGDLQQARGYFTDVLARFSRLGDVVDVSHRAIAGELLGLVLCDCGEHELAAAHLRESLDEWRMVGTRESLIDWLAMVATLAEAVGELVRSCRWFGAVEAQVEIYGFNFPLPERVEFDRIAESVRTGSADPTWTAGRKLSLDQVTEEAANWLDEILARPGALTQRR